MTIEPDFSSLFAWEQPADHLLKYIDEARRSGRTLHSTCDLNQGASLLLPGAGSPHVTTDPGICTFSGDEDGEYRLYDPHDMSHWQREVGQALGSLDSARTHAASLVKMSLIVLAVRADQKCQSPYSSSWRGKPGLAAVTNPHLAPNLRAFLMNALVHEAIHSALYCYEEDCAFVRSGDHRATSMWTGASLRLASLVHAVFVWYGLLHLWISPHGSRVDEDGRFLKRASAGFRKNPLQEINVHRQYLREGLLDCLEALVKRAVAIAGSSHPITM